DRRLGRPWIPADLLREHGSRRLPGRPESPGEHRQVPGNLREGQPPASQARSRGHRGGQSQAPYAWDRPGCPGSPTSCRVSSRVRAEGDATGEGRGREGGSEALAAGRRKLRRAGWSCREGGGPFAGDSTGGVPRPGERTSTVSVCCEVG